VLCDFGPSRWWKLEIFVIMGRVLKADRSVDSCRDRGCILMDHTATNIGDPIIKIPGNVYR
jgi:hypothetical protein